MKSNCVEGFERLLAALEQELIEATDEELLDAAEDLGMNPALKGSAAFFGITIAPRPTSGQGDAGESSDAPGPQDRAKGDPPP